MLSADTEWPPDVCRHAVLGAYWGAALLGWRTARLSPRWLPSLALVGQACVKSAQSRLSQQMLRMITICHAALPRQQCLGMDASHNHQMCIKQSLQCLSSDTVPAEQLWHGHANMK